MALFVQEIYSIGTPVRAYDKKGKKFTEATIIKSIKTAAKGPFTTVCNEGYGDDKLQWVDHPISRPSCS